MTPDQDDHDLDPILQRHFATALDPQLGRAGEAFAAHLRHEPVRRARFAWLVPIGIAAAAAAVVAVVVFPHRPTPHETPGPVASAEPQATLEQVVWSRTIDAGTVFLDDNTPARKVVREQVREVRWTDATGARHVQATVPQRDVMLISLDKY